MDIFNKVILEGGNGVPTVEDFEKIDLYYPLTVIYLVKQLTGRKRIVARLQYQ